MTNPLLRLDNVSFRYHASDDDVISGITESVYSGEIVAVIGPNGAGKSTLLKAVSGIEKKSGGEIFIRSQKIEKYSRTDIAKILSFLPQEISEWYNISVAGITMQGRAPYLKGMGFAEEKDIKICEESMKLCGVYELRNRSINALSGGEKQRARLASIIAQETEILMLDEPTAFLDIHNELELFSLFANLAKSGKAVFMATHNLNLAALFCSRLILLDKGKIVVSGKPSEVITQENILKVYGKGFNVVIHPDSGKPVLYPGIFPEGIV